MTGWRRACVGISLLQGPSTASLNHFNTIRLLRQSSHIACTTLQQNFLLENVCWRCKFLYSCPSCSASVISARVEADPWSPFLIGQLLLRKPSSECLANLKKVWRTKFVLNWANFYFANLVGAVWQTAMKLCLGSKMLRSTCSGNCSSSLTNLASDWLKPDSSPMEEEKTGTATHGWGRECFQPLASEEMASFVDLWEGQRYLWDPAEKD